MIDQNEALLVRKTGEGSDGWASRAADEGITTEKELRAWLKARDVTGYSAMAVTWKLFGYPEFFLRDADELLEGQYADRPALRPIAEALLQWAAANGVAIQMRKTYISLQSPNRKFAQITPATLTSVDVTLRIDAPEEKRLDSVKTRADDPFDRRLRLKTVDDVDDAVHRILALALEQNS